MQVDISNHWEIFICCLALFLFMGYILERLSKSFYTQNIYKQKFSILDLQFPASCKSLNKLLSGINKLPNNEGRRVIRALKANLYLDFLFMLGLYPAVFLLCMGISFKLGTEGKYFFATLAWLQMLAFLFDILENIFLLNEIKIVPKTDLINRNDSDPLIIKMNKKYSLYQQAVKLKWIIVGMGAICSTCVLLLFWVTGDYYKESLGYLIAIVGMFVGVLLLNVLDKIITTGINKKKEA